MHSHPVLELIQQPGSPNLYWALSELPRPIVDFRAAYEAEMNVALPAKPLHRLEQEVDPFQSISWPT